MKWSKQLIVVLMTLVFVLSMGHTSEASSLEKQSTANLQKQINALKKENSALKKNLETSKKEISNLKKKVTNVEKSNKSLTAKINEYKKYEKGVKTKSGVVKSIRVTENQAEFYLDGQRLLPTVSKGKTPRTFVFDNQLYAPIESVGKALLGGQKPTTWNATKQAMYFGIAPKGKVQPLTNNNIFDYSSITVDDSRDGNDISFKILEDTYYPSNVVQGSWGSWVQYALKGNYQSIKGKYAIPQNRLNDDNESALSFHSVDSYGNKQLIQRYNIKSGDPFVNVDVDLSGVQYLQITLDRNYSIFHNITLESLID
ncbi:hypothetical protein [Exiguobacterium alkaliphilum]|uniref:Glycosyl hydrolase family 98 putative carbohydrate-binding module domain-containing protein n=1 Tax=Exiguobacterium alkaliphilum TaxID=1428684 RepID=A0ABT2KY45_9BACL|nr:hypothetical protein [Exiguobacterium alkaliphilum]MCT4795366.1 hypothetical protein [Exiguobacterium alkaliphilum]